VSYNFIQDTATAAGSGLTTIAPSITVGAGHALLVWGQGSSGGNGATPPTISDNNGNSANYVYAGQCIDGFSTNNFYWYLLNANAGATAVKIVSGSGTIQNLYVAEYSGLGTFINISTNFINGASTGANTLSSNSITISSTAMLWGFGFNNSSIAMSAGTSPIAFTARGASGYSAKFSSEDAPTSATGAATFGCTNGSSQFFIGAMAFTLASPAMAVSPVVFALTLENASLAYGASFSLAASPLAFALTLEAATLGSPTTLSLGALSFGFTVVPDSFIYTAANYEILMAPLTFFVDMEGASVGNQLNLSAIAWQWTPQNNALSNISISNIRSRSAWTADSALVTADSINFTCDGSDLINNGGVPIHELVAGQSSNKLAYSIGVPLFVQYKGGN
jgi:hypothetical protein